MSRQPLSPQISELPKLLNSSGWVWSKPAYSTIRSRIRPHWWIGTDTKGCSWLVKMTNGLSAYREHVFSSLAQRLGISCQSSTYLMIESDAVEPRMDTPHSEPYQLALWLMEEHVPQACTKDCMLSDIIGKEMEFSSIMRGCTLGIPHLDDLVRGDVLGHLCGQHESHDPFFTRDHEYVVIDNELMFSTTSCLHECNWHDYDAARPLIIEVCRGLATITDQEFREMATLPEGYAILNRPDLYHDLLAARTAADEYLEIFDDSVR